MTIKNCLSLASYNLVRHKKSSLQILFSLCFVVIMLICFMCYYISLDMTMKGMLNKDLSSNYFSLPMDKEKEAAIKDINGVTELKTRGYDDSIHKYMYLSGEKILMQKEEWVGFYFEEILSSILSVNEKKEFGEKPLYVYGREMRADNECVVTERFCENRGISPQAMLSKALSVSVRDYSSDGNEIQPLPYINEKIVVGIVSDEVYSLNGASTSMPIVYFLIDETLPGVVYQYDAQLRDYFVIEEVRAELLKLYSADSVWYRNYGMATSMTLFRNQKFLTERIFLVTGLVIIIAVVTLILTVVLHDFESKKKYLGMLLASGLTITKLMVVYFFEILILFLLALLFAGGLSFAVMKIIAYITMLVAGVEVVIYLFGFMLVFGITLVIGVLLSFFIAAVVLLRIKIGTICKLLKN